MEVFRIKSSDGKTKLYCQKWRPEGTPRAVVQLIHGMNEYIDRYKDFAAWLADMGMVVVGDDHLGHGKTVQNEADRGYFGHKDAWKNVIEDEHRLRETVQSGYPDIPYIMLGFSFGSFILRAYLATQDTSGLSGAIVMGTSGTHPELEFGIISAKILKLIQGEKARSKFITIMAFGSYNKRVQNPVNHYAWLSSDEDFVQTIPKDSNYRFFFTNSGYLDVFKMLKFISSDECYQNTPGDIPILICSGWDDPVGNYGIGPAEVTERLQDAGCNVNMVLYEGMRHELLNEKDKQTVWEDMLGYILDMADGVCDVSRGFECSFD